MLHEVVMFYRRWLGVAFQGALDRTALIAFVILSALDAAKHYFPSIQRMTESAVWAVPFWVLAGVVVWRLLAAPFLIWKQDTAVLETQEALTAKRAALGRFLNEGNQLLSAFEGGADLQELMEQVADWRVRTIAFLDEQFDPSYHARFMNSAGILSGEPLGMDADRLSRWRWLNKRVIRLDEILKSL